MSIAYKHNKAIKVFLIFGKIYGYYYPHFVVKYNGSKAKIAMDRSLLEGFLPAEIEHLALDWAKDHYLELEGKWNQIMDREISKRKSTTFLTARNIVLTNPQTV